MFKDQTGNTTVISCITVRETSICQHHGGPIEGSAKTLGLSQQYCIEWFKISTQLSPHYAVRRKSLEQLSYFFSSLVQRDLLLTRKDAFTLTH